MKVMILWILRLCFWANWLIFEMLLMHADSDRQPPAPTKSTSRPSKSVLATSTPSKSPLTVKNWPQVQQSTVKSGQNDPFPISPSSHLVSVGKCRLEKIFQRLAKTIWAQQAERRLSQKKSSIPPFLPSPLFQDTWYRVLVSSTPSEKLLVRRQRLAKTIWVRGKFCPPTIGGKKPRPVPLWRRSFLIRSKRSVQCSDHFQVQCSETRNSSPSRDWCGRVTVSAILV